MRVDEASIVERLHHRAIDEADRIFEGAGI